MPRDAAQTETGLAFNEQGVSTIEYGLIAALIAVAATGALYEIGKNGGALRPIFSCTAQVLDIGEAKSWCKQNRPAFNF